MRPNASKQSQSRQRGTNSDFTHEISIKFLPASSEDFFQSLINVWDEEMLIAYGADVPDDQ